MTKNEFFEAVKDSVLEILRKEDQELDCVIGETMKANCVALSSLTFKSNTGNIQPVIYIDEFYDKYLSEDTTVAEAARKVADIYMNNKWDGNLDVSKITDFSQVMDRVILSLYSNERNEAALKDLPHVAIENTDLSAFFKILLPDDIQGGTGTITVHNGLFSTWNVSVEELYDTAWANTRRLCPPDFKSMAEVLRGMCSMDLLEDFDDAFGVPQMYVLSTSDKTNGSIYMIDTLTLADIADKLEDNLIILPSSRLEVIVLPQNGTDNFEFLKSMVEEVNSTQVEPVDVLSDSVYLFERDSKQVRLCA